MSAVVIALTILYLSFITLLCVWIETKQNWWLLPMGLCLVLFALLIDRAAR